MIDICSHCLRIKKCIKKGSWNLCKEHSELKQYQEKIKTKTKIRTFSKKRTNDNSKYFNKRKQYLLKHIKCETNECENESTEIHHKKGRIGELLYKQEYFLAVCRGCHQKIELNPKWSFELGYSIKRNEL